MEEQKIRIAIIDDENLFLEGLKLVLDSENDIHITLSITDGNMFLDSLSAMDEQDFPHIALVDIQMKPMDGFDLVDVLTKTYPDLKIVIISSHYNENVIGHMIKLGASAFIPKNSKKSFLVEVIRSVHKTGIFFSTKDYDFLRSFMKKKISIPSLNSIVNLTNREREILKQICLEKTNAEIAESLFLSKRTIDGHRLRLLDKTGAKNTAGLVIFAIANQIHVLKSI